VKFFILCIFIFSPFAELRALDCSTHPIYKKLESIKAKCEKKSVHLSFDDGPDTKNTPVILEKLTARGVQASFYVSTTNLKPGEPNQTLLDMLKHGHIVASHGHHHHAHDLRLIQSEKGLVCDPHMLSPEESQKQIDLSIKLISQATNGLSEKQEHMLFRFPFGRGASPSPKEMEALNRFGSAQQVCGQDLSSLESDPNYTQNLKDYRQFESKALQRLHGQGRDHVGWNYDSQDSVASVAKKASEDTNWYIEKTLTGLCENPQNSIMALFHDNNKPFNAQTMGDIVDIGRCLGLKFVTYSELLKQREFLTKIGVLQEAPRLESQDFKDVVKLINNPPSPNSNTQCSSTTNNTENKKVTCLSSNGKSYQHCQGESYICVNGAWVSAEHSDVEKFCSKKQCYSEYTKTYYNQCQGKDSICIGGEWLKKTDARVQEICFY
jgi:peptidoglycan/xylan/chitin deacetylase (PgdA/CDA1 family)